MESGLRVVSYFYWNPCILSHLALEAVWQGWHETVISVRAGTCKFCSPAYSQWLAQHLACSSTSFNVFTKEKNTIYLLNIFALKLPVITSHSLTRILHYWPTVACLLMSWDRVSETFLTQHSKSTLMSWDMRLKKYLLLCVDILTAGLLFDT